MRKVAAVGLLMLGSSGAAEVVVSESDYGGRPHFVARTPNGTWYYDQAGGGFSRLIDPEGRDWIGFKNDRHQTYPESAGAGYRGLPNCVHGGPEGGAGHPGFDHCTSERVGPNRVVTRSKSGDWQWSWTFHPTHARFHMIRTPGNRPWWFLYEGTPGGEFAPNTLTWGTDAGRRTDRPDFVKGEEVTGHWRWAYFGRQDADRVLLVGRCQSDPFPDVFGILGNTRQGLSSPDGMTVFGFGRAPQAKPQFYRAGAEFVVALLARSVRSDAEHKALADQVRNRFPELAARTKFPGEDWEKTPPSEAGFDPDRLQAAVEYLQSVTPSDGVRELLIARRGQVVWHVDTIDKRHGTWSCTKSFTSTALGLLVEDGKCSPETRATDILPDLKDRYPDVTLRHFTTMTSGYRAVGDDPTPDGYAHGPSKTPFLPGEPLFPPGEKYAYWDSAMNTFGLALTKLAGESLEDLVRRRVMGPIGVPQDQWQWGVIAEADGVKVNGGSGNNSGDVRISARHLARFGHLYLNQGNWGGSQLIDPKWVAMATTVQVPNTLSDGFRRSGIGGAGTYGFNWWANGEMANGQRLWPDLPRSTFAAKGYNNNRLWIVPEWELVVVRLGLDQKEKTLTDGIANEFLKRLGEAMTDRTN